jgi:DNA-binding Xre family transcriptional regulator
VEVQDKGGPWCGPVPGSDGGRGQEHGLSQWKLADRAGIGLTTLARLERQRQAPCRTYTLARIAAALDEQPAAISFAPPSS